MKKVMKLMMVFSLVAALALAPACAHLATDRGRTQAEGAAVGLGIGAIVGAGVGALIGGRSGALKGVWLGGLAGLISGLIYGNHVADKKEKYATEEAWLADCLAQAKKSNEEAIAYNEQLKTALAAYSAKAEKSDARAIKDVLDMNKKVMASLDEEVTSQRKAVSLSNPGSQSQELQTQIAALEKQKAELEKNNKELAAIHSRVAI